MKNNIIPDGEQLEQIRKRIEQSLDRFQYNVDVDDVDFILSWQKFEGQVSVISANKKSVQLAFSPELDELERIDEAVLLGLLECEFLQKADYKEINFRWQEVMKFAYVNLKANQILDREPVDEDLKEEWPEIKEHISEDLGSERSFVEANTGVIGEILGKKLVEDYELNELPELKQSDLIEAGEELYE